MRLLVLAAVLVSASACAQTGEKPSASGDDRARRADSVVNAVSPVPRVNGEEVVTLTNNMDVFETDLALGEGTVTLRWTEMLLGDDMVTFLNIHDNEDTSVEAAVEVVRTRGGVVMELVHTGDRHVRFDVDGAFYEADPNRMFTAVGRSRTLTALSTDTEAAHDALAEFSEAVLRNYERMSQKPLSAVVTLHNNTDENYSAASYLPGAVYASDAEAVTVHDGTDADDFFFVTDRGLYDALVARGFNAVLQDNEAATDDGSLSVWAARENVPYVNVEAQHGHRAEQARMIEALLDVLAER